MIKRLPGLVLTVLILCFCAVSALSAEEYETISAGETKTAVVSRKSDAYFQFTPETSGTYLFYSVSGSDTYGGLYDSTKSGVLAVDDESGEGSNFCITYNFEAGTVYYFTARYYTPADGSFEVRLEKVGCAHKTTGILQALEATCTAVGYTEGSICLECDEVVVPQQEIAIDSDNHTGAADVVKNKVTATCTKDGYSGDVYWSCCDTLAASGQTVPSDKTAHTGAADVVKNKVTATCTKDGYSGDIYWSCCDTIAASGQTIPADKTAHTGTADAVKNKVSATCTKDGYSGDIYWSCCDILAASGQIVPSDKTAHTGTSDVVKNKATATCTKDGYSGDLYWSCCDKLATSGVIISADPYAHTGKADLVKNARTSTCKDAGYTGDIYWSCCGAFKEKGTQTPKTNHNYGAYKTVKTETCISAGEKEKVCTICGDVVTAEIGIADHSYKAVTTKATLSKNGKVVNLCTCGKVASSTKIYCPETISLSKTSYTYNGKVQKPSVTVKDSKGKALKNGTDYTVSYEKGCKETGRYTVKITFKGRYEGTKKLTFTIIPKATGRITAKQSTSAVSLTWKKVTGADGYVIYQYNTKTKKYDKIKTIKSGKTASYKIQKLKAGTKYKFMVKAYTSDDGTIFGKSATILTATKTATPKITKLITSTKGKASLVWSDVAGESGYQVYYSTGKDSGYEKLGTYKANVVKGSKSKLRSGKKYYFKVRAFVKTDSGIVYSSWSDVKSIKIK